MERKPQKDAKSISLMDFCAIFLNYKLYELLELEIPPLGFLEETYMFFVSKLSPNEPRVVENIKSFPISGFCGDILCKIIKFGYAGYSILIVQQQYIEAYGNLRYCKVGVSFKMD